MRNRVYKYIGLFLLLFIIGGMVTAKPCLAASAEVTISSSTPEVTVDEKVMVYITIESTAAFGDFEANVTYDNTILEYQGGASVVSGSDGFLRIYDMGVTDSDNKRKYAIEFKALKVGTSKISFEDRAMVYSFDSGLEMSVSSNDLDINVKAAQTASNNANLKSLVTNPVNITPAFDKNNHEYSVNVGNETEQLIITAISEDQNAKVSISGNDFLKEGENKVIVTVLAESGDVIEYIIKVFREKTEEAAVTPTIMPSETPGLEENQFEVLEIEGIKYAIYSGSYQLLEPGSEVVIPEGYIKTSIIISGTSVTAFEPKDAMVSNFYLIYAKNASGEAGFYQYDKIEKTLQRFVSVTSDQTNSSDTSESGVDTKDYKSNLSKAAAVIALLTVLCASLVFVIVWMYIKSRKEK